MYFYFSSLRTEITLTEMEKSIREASLEKDPELSFRNVKFAGPIRHPSGDVQ